MSSLKFRGGRADAESAVGIALSSVGMTPLALSVFREPPGSNSLTLLLRGIDAYLPELGCPAIRVHRTPLRTACGDPVGGIDCAMLPSVPGLLDERRLLGRAE